MKKNVGSADSIIRIVIAAIVGVLFYTGTILGIVLLVLAGVLLLTGFVSFCPLYSIFGVRSCPIDTNDKSKN